MHPPNSLLESDVKEAFDYDPMLDHSRIVVKVNDGRVTLTGAVATFDDVERATKDVHLVAGVKAVDNQLRVGPSGNTIADTEIAAACATALGYEKFVPKGSVHVTVNDGFVHLFGEVRRHFQRRAAEHAVGRVDGVLGVTDLITLTEEPIPSDVAARIHKALERNAIIDSSLVKVSNEGHTIYLDGAVSSWVAMETATDTAWNAPGVSEVVNRLLIAP